MNGLSGDHKLASAYFKRRPLYSQRSNGPGIPSPPRLERQQDPGRAKRACESESVHGQGGMASVGHRPEEHRQHSEQPVNGLHARVEGAKRVIATRQCLGRDRLQCQIVRAVDVRKVESSVQRGDAEEGEHELHHIVDLVIDRKASH